AWKSKRIFDRMGTGERGGCRMSSGERRRPSTVDTGRAMPQHTLFEPWTAVGAGPPPVIGVDGLIPLSSLAAPPLVGIARLAAEAESRSRPPRRPIRPSPPSAPAGSPGHS